MRARAPGLLAARLLRDGVPHAMRVCSRLWIVAPLALPLPLLACPPLSEETSARVNEAAATIDAAIRRGDRAALEPLVAETFEQVLGNGERVDRRRFVTALTTGPAAQFTVSRMAVCGWADTAVVTFDAEFVVADAPIRRTVSTFIVNIYRRQPQHSNARWQLAFEQIGVRR